MSHPFTYVYLSSPSYVGATYLELLASIHPQVTTVGELTFDFSPYYQCTCGKRFCECEFWTDWQKQVQAQGLPFEIGNLNINLQPTIGGGFKDRLFYYEFSSKIFNGIRNWIYEFPPLYQQWGAKAKEAINRAESYAEILCQRENASVFLDTSKNPYQIRFLAKHLKHRFKLIYMIRDARAQICELMKREGFSVKESILLFKWYYRNLERFITHYVRPEDVFRIRYEDLCDDTENILKSLCRFLEIEMFSPLTEQDMILPNRYHFLTNTYHPIPSCQLDEAQRWKTELTQEQIATIDTQLGTLNRFYGYA